jgi:hypothetical protein
VPIYRRLISAMSTSTPVGIGDEVLAEAAALKILLDHPAVHPDGAFLRRPWIEESASIQP